MTLYDLKKGSLVDTVGLPLSVALGSFDGLHLGHAELIRHAKRSEAKSCVFSFSDNPFAAPRIISLRDKLSILCSMGVDYAAICDFDSIKNMTSEEFEQKILIDTLNARTVVCGFNFKFGKGGCGTPGELCEFMRSIGGRCIVVPPVCVASEAVSSTRIRRALESGDTETAAKLLSRQYSVTYEVSHGNGIGSTLGFPTINHYPDKHDVILSRGVYACKCLGRPAVTNVGVRPTVTHEGRLVYETFILDYRDDLYGKTVKVEFFTKLRPEIKFDSLDSLKKQIACDSEQVRKYFN